MANLNKLKKYHFLYKTTNLLNGKFYIGIHSTSNLKDGYLGSGKRLRYSIKKYGKANFKLEILEFFDSRELLVEREKQLVNEDLLKDLNCMNLSLGGGGGGFSSEAHKSKFIEAGKNNFLYFKEKREESMVKVRLTKEYRQSQSIALKNWYRFNDGNFKNRKHSTETKQKMSEAKKGKGTGKANSQFGTMWITNGVENKKIKKEEIIPIGWKNGRFNTKDRE